MHRYICLFFFFECVTVLFGTAHAVLYQKWNFLFNIFNEKLKYKNLLRITPQKHPSRDKIPHYGAIAL